MADREVDSTDGSSGVLLWVPNLAITTRKQLISNERNLQFPLELRVGCSLRGTPYSIIHTNFLASDDALVHFAQAAISEGS